MPYVELITNQKLSIEEQKALAVSLTEAAAEILGKPASLFGVKISSDQVYSYGGTFEPAFMLHVTALNIFNPENNIKFSAGFTKWLADKLNLPSDRGYISFYNPTDPNIGFKGTTMAEVRKMK